MELPHAFPEIRLERFDFEWPPGERPTPTRLHTMELLTGRTFILEREELNRPAPPYSSGPEVLVVSYDAPAHLGCRSTLGWRLPEKVLDLHAEFRRLTAGLDVPGGYELGGALAHFGLPDGGGVEALASLLSAMLPTISLGHALLRGRYTAAVARMEAVGVPIDLPRFQRLRANIDRLRDALIQQVDGEYGVFRGGKFHPPLWGAWAKRNNIPWPRTCPWRLDLRRGTFREMAKKHAKVRPMRELLALLRQVELFRVTVGADGRNRCRLRPFASKTGRNQPSTAEFIFGPASWVRGLIKPAEGMALTYVDYEQQEFGIAAALSGDPEMQAAYNTGDPYLAFAKQAGVVPTHATKQTHGGQRERFKHAALGVQYGIGAKSLAKKLHIPLDDARELLRLHKSTYSTYWRWSRKVGLKARKEGQLKASFGWTLNVGPGANRRSVRNFPLQANGAEMLRLASCSLTEAGIRVCATVHDAFLIEAPAEDIDQAVAECQRAMRKASEHVLDGFALRTEVKVVSFPDCFEDERGWRTWEKVSGLLDQMRWPPCE
jgi:DNA polymerase I